MSLTVSCPCGSTHEMPDDWAGKRGKCPDCGRVLKVPRPRAQRREAQAPAPKQPEQGEPAEPAKPEKPEPVKSEDFVPFEMKDAEKLGFHEKEEEEGAIKVEGGVISFKCACGKALRASLEKAGMRAKCPRCHQAIEVPKPPTEAAALDLFEYVSEEESEATQCANCAADMNKGSIICVECGTNKISGEKVDTKIGDEAFPDEKTGLKDLLGKVAFWKKKSQG